MSMKAYYERQRERQRELTAARQLEVAAKKEAERKEKVRQEEAMKAWIASLDNERRLQRELEESKKVKLMATSFVVKVEGDVAVATLTPWARDAIEFAILGVDRGNGIRKLVKVFESWRRVANEINREGLPALESSLLRSLQSDARDVTRRALEGVARVWSGTVPAKFPALVATKDATYHAAAPRLWAGILGQLNAGVPVGDIVARADAMAIEVLLEELPAYYYAQEAATGVTASASIDGAKAYIRERSTSLMSAAQLEERDRAEKDEKAPYFFGMALDQLLHELNNEAPRNIVVADFDKSIINVAEPGTVYS